MNQQKLGNATTRQAMAEQLWLSYYNNTLLELGLITEAEHRRMKVKINSRKTGGPDR